MPRHCYVLRVFTRDGQGGNPLGVVTDTLGLDATRMQDLATDLGFSETIFLNWFEGPRPTARIFTPQTELAFAGHPLVGAAWVLLNLGPLDPGAIDCAVGSIPIRQVGDLTWVDAPAGQPVRSLPVPAGGGGGAIELVEVEMPLAYLLVEVESAEAVKEASPGLFPSWGEVYVWALDAERVRARFFGRGVGVTEDPATGSAAVALAARMRHRGFGEGSLLIHQGDETGYPSRIHLTWDAARSSLGGRVARDEVRFLRI